MSLCESAGAQRRPSRLICLGGAPTAFEAVTNTRHHNRALCARPLPLRARFLTARPLPHRSLTLLECAGDATMWLRDVMGLMIH